MYHIKPAKNFDGIRALMSAEQFTKTMYCLDKGLAALKTYGYKDLEAKCEKLHRILTTMSYFDIENEEAHIQLGYKELETLFETIALVALYEGDTEYSFAKCAERPDAKIWK